LDFINSSKMKVGRIISPVFQQLQGFRNLRERVYSSRRAQRFHRASACRITQPQGLFQIPAQRQTLNKPGAKTIARACRIHHFVR
jgi:hypothetical protein